LPQQEQHLAALRHEQQEMLERKSEVHQVCHECQGSDGTIYCQSYDCNIFYARCKIDDQVNSKTKSVWKKLDDLE
jgi:hypothetical protein